MHLNFTVIRTFSSVAEASIACSMLQAEGVNAQLYNEELVIMDWTAAIAFGGMKVVVPAREISNAIEILSQNASLPLLVDDSNLIREGDYFNQYEPATGANKKQKFRMILLVYLLSIPRINYLMMFLLFFLTTPLIFRWKSESDKFQSMKVFSYMFITCVISVFITKQIFLFLLRWM